MILVLVLICGSSAVLLYLAWKLMLPARPQYGTITEWDAEKRSLDIEVFRLLVDKQEVLYLRRSLPRSYLRRVLQHRALVAQRYVAAIEENAQMLLRIASKAQSSADPETARAAKELIKLILEVRLNTIIAIWCLRVRWLFPTWTFPLPTRLDAYNRLLDRGTSLLKSPTAATPKATGIEADIL